MASLSKSVRFRVAAIASSAMIALVAAAVPTHANRFGAPWMSMVSTDQTTLYSDRDRTTPVGSVPKGAIIVVVGSQSDMTRRMGRHSRRQRAYATVDR